MEDIVQLRLLNKSRYTENDRTSIVKFFSDVIQQAIKLNIWDESIKAIVITDDFKNEIESQATKWKIVAKVSQEKESIVASKIVFNHNLDEPERHIFFDFLYFNNPNLPLYRIALGQILSISTQKLLPAEVIKDKFNFHPTTLNDYVKNASTEWCKATYTQLLLEDLIEDEHKITNHNSFLTAFKRKLKRNLFEYNGDELDRQDKLNVFWDNYFDSLKTLFLRIVENQTSKEDLMIKENESSRNLIYEVVKEIAALTKRCLKKEDYDVTKLKEAIKEFSAHYEVFLEDETERNFRIRLTKDPKDYFNNEIVETEPRLVCFMDILGFSELINDYDNDITSTVLQDIQESFALAQTQLLNNKLPPEHQSAVRHLKYQTFSDNICISIPYFNNEVDFMINFNLLATYVRGFQLIMMHKGFFTRGGISMGSYYADNNIIFSKGLVDAYLLESKKAIYPRIIIDKSIVLKLFKYCEKVKEYGLGKVIVFDWENTAFLNSFGFAESTYQQIKMIYSKLYTDDNDVLSDSLNSMVKNLEESTTKLLGDSLELEKKNIEPIRIKVIEKLFLYKENEAILSKYLWLFEFIRWIQKDEDVKLKFTFISERIKN